VEERKPEKKAKDKKDGSEGGSRKTSWGWLLGSDDKEKDSHKKEKEDREKELAKRVKNKLSKHPEKGSDDTRLDVLQSSISGSRGRESVILDRDSIKLEEERKKESSRKTSSGDSSKKERDSSLFSSIFGGSKKKSEKSESSHKKGSSSLRDISPNPPPRELRPDIDYNWTRFSILEERAIYRMAHIKLANPRRELYSQVLLSNFMYSYLAKVQQMHPQIQIGTSKQAQVQQRQQAAQQQAQQQKKEKEREQEESGQYTRYQQEQQRTVANSEVLQRGDSRSASAMSQESTPNQPYRPDSRRENSDARECGQGQGIGETRQAYGGNKANGSYSVSYNLGNPPSSGHGHGHQQQQLQQNQQYYGYDDSDHDSNHEDMW